VILAGKERFKNPGADLLAKLAQGGAGSRLLSPPRTGFVQQLPSQQTATRLALQMRQQRMKRFLYRRQYPTWSQRRRPKKAA